MIIFHIYLILHHQSNESLARDDNDKIFKFLGILTWTLSKIPWSLRTRLGTPAGNARVDGSSHRGSNVQLRRSRMRLRMVAPKKTKQKNKLTQTLGWHDMSTDNDKTIRWEFRFNTMPHRYNFKSEIGGNPMDLQADLDNNCAQEIGLAEQKVLIHVWIL